ncbi:DUF4875 domain-containing protein, partial [Desulfovibrio sp. OttesenSCG-928-M14]|nr:DUF4875 domain-containing protein [Desulfovibrio sp. OttesenSCG-928-M14]
GLYLGLFLLFVVLAGSCSTDEKIAPEADQGTKFSVTAGERPAGGVLKWKENSRREVPMQNGRTRLMLTISPLDDQSGATRQDLLSTATGAAMRYQKESGLPVVIVSLAPREVTDGPAEPLLAHVVYIPDGKGFDGLDEGQPQWESLRAAERGFTQAELEYLKLWGELYQQYQGRSGLQAEELDAAISAKLELAPGTLKPFDNKLQDVDNTD